MKSFRTVFAGVALATVSLLSGCTAMNTAAEGIKDKNIVLGSDTWGGDVTASLIGTAESAPLSFSAWFGRRKVWYASVKNGNDVKVMPEIVKASNTPLNVSANPASLGVTQSGSEGK